MSVYQSEMMVPIRPAPPPPVNASASHKQSKQLIAWNGSTRVNKSISSESKKKPPPRPPPPKFPNSKQDKKPIPARPSQLITSLFNKKNSSSRSGDSIIKSNADIIDSKGNNVLSLIDFNSPPSSPTFTTRSSSDALSVNSFGSDGVTPCSTSSGNASNVESGFEDDFEIFLGTSRKSENHIKDPWNIPCPDQVQRQKVPSPLLVQNQKVNNKNSWVSFSSSTSGKKNVNDVSAMPTIIRVKPERPKPPVKEKVTYSVPTSNVDVLAEIFENAEQNFVLNPVGSIYNAEDEEDDDGWSSESPPMPTCPPPDPPLEILKNLIESKIDVLSASGSKPHGIALYDFSGEHPDDLNFKENDIVNLVRRIDDNWYLGEVNGREGTVPANFLSIRVPIGDHTADNRVTALYSFRAEAWNDLDFEQGSVINVLGRINQDWLYGECNGKTGQFPTNFVDRVPQDLPFRDH